MGVQALRTSGVCLGDGQSCAASGRPACCANWGMFAVGCSVDWSPNGHSVVSGGKDKLLKLWRQ